MKKFYTSLLLCLSFGGVSAQTQDVEVLELHPAPGQFVNTLPKADENTTHEEICKKQPKILMRVVGLFI